MNKKRAKEKQENSVKKGWYIWILVGILMAGVLIFLQLGFREYMRLNYDGYAVTDENVDRSLAMVPGADDIKTSVLLSPFSVLDFIYCQGEKLFLGENEKTQMMSEYPIYLNDGESIQLVNDRGTLYTDDFGRVLTFTGLILMDRHSYNITGERADGCEFSFLELNNGNYVNLCSVTYQVKGNEYDINRNSIVHFDKKYLSYYEMAEGTLIYKSWANVKLEDIITVDGEEMTYKDLLLRLNVMGEADLKEKAEEQENSANELTEEEKEKEKKENLTEIENQVVSLDELNGDDHDDAANKKDRTQKEHTSSRPQGAGTTVTPVKATPGTPSAPQEKPARQEKADKPDNEEGDDKPRDPKPPKEDDGDDDDDPDKRDDEDDKDDPADEPQKPVPGEGKSPGVRPDILKPGKGDDDDEDPEEEKDPEYVKPTAEVSPFQAFVYRITAELSVTDPASRLQPQKALIEVYEKTGQSSEQVVYRISKGAGVHNLEIGGGVIKPSTTYRVVTTLYYNDEYNTAITELVNEDIVTTNSLESLGTIDLSVAQDIPYKNKIALKNISYREGSDEEAVYGLNNRAGLILYVKKNGTEVTKMQLSPSSISNIKQHGMGEVSTLPILEPKTEYQYEIEGYDYFGSKLKLRFNTGIAVTCKNSPEAFLEMKENMVGSVTISAKLNDVDESIEQSEASLGDDTAEKYDIWFVIRKEKNALLNMEELNDQELVSYKKKIIQNNDSEAGYLIDGSSGQVTFGAEGIEFLVEGLRLDERYYAQIYCDYNLDNGQGIQRFNMVGSMSFTTAGLAKLGKVYLTGAADELTYNSFRLSFGLNRDMTNKELQKFLTSAEIQVHKGLSEEDDDYLLIDTVGFTKEESFPADYEIEEAREKKLYQWFQEGNYVNYSVNELESMTEYMMTPTVTATYTYLDGTTEDYEINSVLNIQVVKTLRSDPEVKIMDPVFAGGQIVFDTYVLDEDESITGISGDKVVVTLYEYERDANNLSESIQNARFVRAIRIKKSTNREQINLQTLTFKGLDSSKDYFVRYTAVDYNNGYDNNTYISNKILKVNGEDQYCFESPIRFSAIIKLQNLNPVISNENQLRAKIRLQFEDEDDQISELSDKNEESYDYYIAVSKNGEAVETIGYEKGEDDDFFLNYDVDKGDDIEYIFTLYVKIGSRQLLLDSLVFTTEDVITDINSAYEMIQKINANPKGKFVVTGPITMYSDATNYLIPDDSESSIGLTGSSLGKDENNNSILHGKIDFQGYELNYHYKKSGQFLFGNIGPRGEVKNLVMNLYMDNESACYDSGVFCYRNFGRISDFILNFKGGEALGNYYFGLIARVNAATGIVENFVINNAPEDGKSPFSTRGWSGMITYENYGVIRNGYACGQSIFADFYPNLTSLTSRYLGTLVGYNQTIGKIYQVYSLVTIDLGTNNDVIEKTDRIGSIVGFSYGYTSDMYGIGENTASKHMLNVGPVIGYVSGKKYNNVYYWNKDKNDDYTSKWNSFLNLESLYDSGWQAAELGSKFDVTTVELGFYPHVKLSSDLPEQLYIPLPVRTSANMVDIAQSEVISYDDTEGNESALIKFRFSNKRGMDITGIEIENLTTTLDLDTVNTEDGYTVIYGTVSNPKAFTSEYAINKISYMNSGVSFSTAYTENKPVLLADFYRNIKTVKEWKKYVVENSLKKEEEQENVRLREDIDFAGVSASEIMVTGTLNAILDGAGHTIRNIDLSSGYTDYRNGICRALFSNTTMSVGYRGKIKQLTVDNYSCGYKNVKEATGFIYSGSYSNLIARIAGGELDDVHVNHMTASGYNYLGGMVGILQDGAVISNCSVTDCELNYIEPTNAETNAYIGGIAGYVENCRMNNSFVTGIVIVANDLKTSYGVGGLIGYCINSVVDSAYTEGEISVRGNNVGGLIGSYKCTAPSIACVRNVVANVFIQCYADMVGGVIGCCNITNNMITTTNNISGLALGDVYAFNVDSKNVGQTIGGNVAKKVRMYGSKDQLVNGMKTDQAFNPDAIRGLLDYETLLIPATFDEPLEFGAVYDYSYVTEGYMPHLFYEGTTVELPYQDNILMKESKAYKIDVRDIQSAPGNLVRVTFNNPNQYDIKDVKIKNLLYEVKEKAQDDRNPDWTVLFLEYKKESEQEFFLDSYVMTEVSFMIDSTEKSMRLNARVPLTFYKDIASVDEWNAINTEYQNYRIVKNLDFSTVSSGHTNKKISRIIGRCSDRQDMKAVISGIKYNAAYLNFILRLNSEMSNLIFEDCTIASSGKNCMGLIGSSYATLNHVDFNNITVKLNDNERYYVGIIGTQNGGDVSDITMNSISINPTNKVSYYSGGFIGQILDIANFSNVTMNTVEVLGKRFIGGMSGYGYAVNADQIHGTDIKVSDTAGFIGGIIGYGGTDDNCRNYRWTNTVLDSSVIPVYDADGKMISSGTEVKCSSSSSIMNYVGGLSGITYYKWGEDTALAENEYQNLVNQILVETKNTSDVGGAFGYNGQTYYNTDIMDSQISAVATYDSTNLKNIGGLTGRCYYGTSYCDTTGVRMDTRNLNSVGLLIGESQVANHKYCYVTDSYIKAESSSPGIHQSVGGMIGYKSYNYYYVNQCGVVNTVIDAETMNDVGGIIGTQSPGIGTNTYIQNSFCYGTVDPDQVSGKLGHEAVADESYYIKGYSNVGALTGNLKSGRIGYSYSNMNVIATKNGGFAGGITGYYDNAYRLNSNKTKTYSSSSLQYNYFTGTVYAQNNGYAGGLCGRTGLNVLDSMQVERSKPNGTGAANEGSYTISNILLPEKINAKFANSIDGEKTEFTGVYSRVWDGTLIQSGAATTVSGDKYAAVYSSWNENVANNRSYGGLSAAALFSTEKIRTNANSSVRFYTNIKWIYAAVPIQADTNWRVMAYNCYGYKALSSGESTKTKSVGNYLPLVRMNGASVALLSDLHIRKQLKMVDDYRQITGEPDIDLYSVGLNYPIYQGNSTERIANNAEISVKEYLETVPNAVRIYASDIQMLNIEFDEQLVHDDCYFAVYSGDQLIAKQEIDRRVYTFRYLFNEDIRVVYGMSENLDTQEEFLEYRRTAEQLAQKIMVYGNCFYAIQMDENGTAAIEYGSGDRVNVKNGEFVHIMNGQALTSDGTVYQVADWSETVTEFENTELLSTVIPLFHFTYQGIEIQSFAGFSIVEGESEIIRKDQVLIYKDTLYPIDGALNNKKYGYLLYEQKVTGQNDTDSLHMVVLGNDGIMVDLMQDRFTKVPEGFVNKGIVAMTSTYQSNVPFVLVQYQNGGIVGFNYLTGEWLIQHYISDSTDLWDYVSDSLKKEKSSENQDVNKTYRENAALSRKITSSEELKRVVTSETATSSSDTEVAFSGKNEGGENQGQEVSGRELAINQTTETTDNLKAEFMDGSGAATGVTERVTNPNGQIRPDSENILSTVPKESKDMDDGGEFGDGTGEGLADGAEGKGNGRTGDESQTDDEQKQSETISTSEKEIGEGSNLVAVDGNESGIDEKNTQKSDVKDSVDPYENIDMNQDDTGAVNDGNDGNILTETMSLTVQGGQMLSSVEENETGENVGENSAVAQTKKESGTEKENTEVQKDSETSENSASFEETPDNAMVKTESNNGSRETPGNRSDSSSEEKNRQPGQINIDTQNQNMGIHDAENNQTVGNDLQNESENETKGLKTVILSDDPAFENKEKTEFIEDSATENTSIVTDQVSEENKSRSGDHFMAVYNSETGTYEIVNVLDYLTKQTYESENANLGIQYLGKYMAGDEQVKEEKEMNGLFIYILVALITLSGAFTLILMNDKKKKL